MSVYTVVKLAQVGALCLDGTPGAFGVLKSPTNSSVWQIYQEGGGWCYDEMDCSERATGDLGSSAGYPTTFPADYAGGIMSPDCDVNPTFCDANKVYMKYCDGDSFSGARDDALEVADGPVSPIYFRGHEILMGTLETLLSDWGLEDAEEVLLTGCSAGGLATYLHTDMVGEWAEANLPQLTKYGAVPVSGFFLDHTNIMGDAVYPEEMAYTFNMANASRGVNQACIADYTASDPDNLWKCNFAHGAYAHTDRPLFALDASFDSWQSGNIFAMGVSDFADCSGDFGECDKYQMYAVNAYQGDFVTQLMQWQSTLSSPQNGAFIYQCFTHCAGVSDGYFMGFTVDGVTMADAVDEWWVALSSSSSNVSYKYTRIDGLLGSDASYTNPTCSSSFVDRNGQLL